MGGQSQQPQQDGSPVLPPMAMKMPENQPLYIGQLNRLVIPSANAEAVSGGIDAGVRSAISQVGSAVVSDAVAKKADARKAAKAIEAKSQTDPQAQAYLDQYGPYGRNISTSYLPLDSQIT